MLRTNRSRAIVALVVIVLLGVFLPPYVTLDRLKPRVAAAMSNALGRQTRFDQITLRLLPQPGFDMTGFVVEDDPGFSAEPMIRANEVTAYLRLTSLWQGRFEVAKLSLQDPSLNLVRNAQGEWNIEALLSRASQVPSAPTTKRRPEARPRFPYIEASDGRINFKFGDEKKPYAFAEADFSLWLAGEGEWRMRLAARPIRTDANLNDTGTIRIEGSVQRTAAAPDTMLHFDYEWEKVQLGNLTNLVWGRDRGWRGTLDVDGSVAGTPREVLLATHARVTDFHRYDILAGDAFSADARCTARYFTDTQMLSAIDCHLPEGAGEVAARGNVGGLLNDRHWEVGITATDVPMGEIIRFARHAKKDMPADLTATGALDGTFSYRTLAGSNAWSGGGSTAEIQLSSRTLDAPLVIGAMRFALGPTPDPLFVPARKPGSPFRPKRTPADQPMISRLNIQPFAVTLGGAAPVTVDGRFDREAYFLMAKGDADVGRIVALATALGLRPPQVGAKGDVHLDVALSGDWQGFAPPLVTGSAQLRNVSAEIKGINAPVQVASATLNFSVNGVDVTNTATSFSGSSVAFQGDLHLPRGCSNLASCRVRFALISPALNLDDLNRLFNPRFHVQPWYHFVVGNAQTTGLLRLQAEGTLATPRLVVKAATINHVQANVVMSGGRLGLKNLTAEIFGGKHKGDWSADFTGTVPVYSGAGTIDKADIAQLAGLTKESWGAGPVSGEYKFSAAGDALADIVGSASGELKLDWRNGLLRHIALQGAPPLRIKDFAGTVTLRNARLSFDAGKLVSPDGIYSVSGSSTFARAIDFRLTGAKRSYSVTGTLERPRVVTPPATEAVLKP
jgi:hypothetical protein